MPKGPVLSNLQKSIGQRVCIEKNKYGTLHYVGTTFFADGLWCGVELDEETGENDGMLNNIRYFTCKKNCGVFVPISEISILNDDVRNDLKDSSFLAKNFRSTEKYTDFNAQNSDLHNLPECSYQHDKSYTISKRSSVKELSVINEENTEYLKSASFSNFTFESDFSNFEKVPSIHQVSTGFDQEKEEFEEGYDSDDSLGILPHLLEEFSSCDNFMLYEDKFRTNLNTTVNLPNNSECQVYASDNNIDELRASPIHIMPEFCSSNKNDESPACITVSTPKFASTPKHEVNYSYVIEEAIYTEQNFFFGLHSSKENIENEKHLESSLDKTKEIDAHFECILPVISNMETSVVQENRDPEKSVMNVTCNIAKPLNINQVLNKTFDNPDFLIGDTCILPVVNSYEDTQHQHGTSDGIDVVTNDLKSQEKCIDAISGNDNVLNVTCNILKPSDIADALSLSLDDKYAGNTEERCIPSNILNATVSYPNVAENGSKSLSDEDSKNAKNILSNILNTTMIYSEKAEEDKLLPKSLAHKNSENAENILSNIFNAASKPYSEKAKTVENNAELLNTTYEKIDMPSKLETKIKVLQPAKDVSNSDLNVINCRTVSKNTNKRSISFSGTDSSVYENESRNNTSYSGKKNNTRKSVGYGGKTISNVEFKDNKPRRNSFAGSMCKSLKSNELVTQFYVDTSKKCAVNENNRNSSLTGSYSKSSCNLNGNKNGLKPAFAGNKIKGIKPVSDAKSKESHLRSETVNFTSFIPGGTKTIVKKPRNSMHFPLKKGSVESCEMFSKDKFKESHLLNETRSTTLLIAEGGKTVVKKPRSSMQFPLRKGSPEVFEVPSEDKSKESNLLNETINTTLLIAERGKTVVKKPHSAMQFPLRKGSPEVFEVPSEDKSKDNCLLNETISTVSLISEGGKTVVKKPRASMHFPLKSSLESCEVPSFKTAKKISPTFPKKKSSLNIPALIQSKATQEPNEDLPVSSNRGNSKKFPVVSSVTSGEKQKVSRIPEKPAFLQKNKSTKFLPCETNTGNSSKSHIPAMKSSSHQGNSKISVSRSQSAGFYPIQKSNSNNTALISGSQKSTQQTTETHVTRATSNIPLSKIPSLLQNKKQIPRVKSSLIAPKRVQR